MFKLLDADEKLVKAANMIKVPNQYLEYVTSTYEKGFIPFSSLQKALQLLGIGAKPFKNDEPKSADAIEVAKPIPSYQVHKGTVFDLVDQAVDFVMSKLNL